MESQDKVFPHYQEPTQKRDETASEKLIKELHERIRRLREQNRLLKEKISKQR